MDQSSGSHRVSDSFFQTSFVTSTQLENAIISKAADVERILNVFKKQEMSDSTGDAVVDAQSANNLKYLEEVSSEVGALQAQTSNVAHKTPSLGSGPSDSSSTED